MEQDLDDTYDVDKIISVLNFDDSSGHADVGGMLERCPCLPPGTETNAVECTIDYEICGTLDIPELETPCLETKQGEPVRYPRAHARAVRSAPARPFSPARSGI